MAVPTLPIASANAILMLDVWYLLRRKVICSSWVTGRLFLEVCFRHLFLVDVELNQSTSYTANFGSWFFRISIRWAFFLAWGLSSTSLFLIFDIDDKRDDVLEAADIDDGDNTKKSPSTIGTTRSKQWKTTETIPTPMKIHLLRESIFFKISSLTYHSVCPLQSSFLVWTCLSSSWFTQWEIIGNEDVWCLRRRDAFFMGKLLKYLVLAFFATPGQ